MIRNPWPLNWKPIEPGWDAKYRLCRHGGRHTIFCMGTKPNGKNREKACEHCYIRQQSMSLFQMTQEKAEIDRVCDRCGESIDNPDTVVYVDMENNRGGLLMTMELCRNCAQEIADWLNGAEVILPPPAIDDRERTKLLEAEVAAEAAIAMEEERRIKRKRKAKAEYMRKYLKQKREEKQAKERAEKEEIRHNLKAYRWRKENADTHAHAREQK